MSRPETKAADRLSQAESEPDFAQGARAMAWAADIDAGLASAGAEPDLVPGLYRVDYRGLTTVEVEVDGVARFELYGRSWAYMLVRGKASWRAVDTRRHEGPNFERNTARAIALRALKRAYGVR